MSGNLWLAIWDTSAWNFWVKFGHRTPWDILGPILAIFEICPLLTAPGPFKWFSENGHLQKIEIRKWVPSENLEDILKMVGRYPFLDLIWGWQMTRLQDRLFWGGGGCNTLKWPQWAVKSQGMIFFYHCGAVKEYLGLIYGIKNKSRWPVLDFWILIAGPCHRPLSANFSYVIIMAWHRADAIGNFGP